MLHEINQKIASIKVDDQTKNAILQLIDLKTDNDMDKVINKIDATNKEIKTLYWVIIAAAAILGTLLTIIALKK